MALLTHTLSATVTKPLTCAPGHISLPVIRHCAVAPIGAHTFSASCIYRAPLHSTELTLNRCACRSVSTVAEPVPASASVSTSNEMTIRTAPGVSILGPVSAEHADVLTPEAQTFVATLHRLYNPRRKELLKRRDERQTQLDAGV